MKSPLPPLCQRGEYSNEALHQPSPFEKGGLRGISYDAALPPANDFPGKINEPTCRDDCGAGRALAA